MLNGSDKGRYIDPDAFPSFEARTFIEFMAKQTQNRAWPLSASRTHH